MKILIFGLELTWVGMLNFFILQWLFVRLGREIKNGKSKNFKLMFFILPLTGWWGDYIYLFDYLKGKK